VEINFHVPAMRSRISDSVSLSAMMTASSVSALLDWAYNHLAQVDGAGCWASHEVREEARQALARHRLAIEIGVNELPCRDRLDRAQSRERQRELARVERGRNLVMEKTYLTFPSYQSGTRRAPR
jgi:hypothetical protein